MNNSNINTKNLIGRDDHKNFIELQAVTGFAQRGGSRFYGITRHEQRLVSDVNLLTPRETRQLIFSESIFGN